MQKPVTPSTNQDSAAPQGPAPAAEGSPVAHDTKYLGKRIHLIGVGGSGMRALAQMLLTRGAIVSGSDNLPLSALENLTSRGATVATGQRAENIPANADLIVYSAAIHEANPELLAARGRGCEVLKYSQMLGRLMQDGCGIAVSGTHGKSTTTAMIAYALTQAGRDPSFIVGATVPQLGGPSGVGKGQHFVAEACEFDRSFLNLAPTLAAILNIDEDHLDCYADLSAIIEAFRQFAVKIPPHGLMVANGEDRDVLTAIRDAYCEIQTFGLADGCRWKGHNLTAERGRFRFDVLFDGHKFCKLELQIPGMHQVYNALAAVALLHQAGMSPAEISQGIAGFEGCYRRMTVKAQLSGITVLDDYAHHPTEVQATLRAIKDYFIPRRIWCVFQPHQHSRTRFLLKDFARCFGSAEKVIVPDIYFVRDSEREKEHISAQDLVAQIRLNGGDAIYLESFKDIIGHLKRSLAPGDLVVTMGAGNIWEVADEIVHWLGSDR
jgi:UDP-N-acetylmuramate--alanine ligase